MGITQERFDDRLEFLRAFLEIKSAINALAIASNLHNDGEVAQHLQALNGLMNSMIARLEKDRG